jgi:Ser-tRNA(Ala) deacylase AlaX
MFQRKPVKVIKRNDLKFEEKTAAVAVSYTTEQTKKGSVVETVSQWIDESRQARLERLKTARMQFGLP